MHICLILQDNINDFKQRYKTFDQITRKGYNDEFHESLLRIWRDKNIQKIYQESKTQLQLPDGFD